VFLDFLKNYFGGKGCGWLFIIIIILEYFILLVWGKGFWDLGDGGCC
jgi:hypothetical protein